MGVSIKGSLVSFTFVSESLADTAILFFDADTNEEVKRITIPASCRRGKLVSITVEIDHPADIRYLYEIDGEKIVDPYATKIYGREDWNDIDRIQRVNPVLSGIAKEKFAWRGDETLKLLDEDLVIYRANLRGLTMDRKLPENKKGNYLGLMSQLKKLHQTGFTAIELQPVYEYEEIRYQSTKSFDKDGNVSITSSVLPGVPGVNLWGYGAGNYFAPKASFFGVTDPEVHLKEMVRAIHRESMEIILEFSFLDGVSAEYVEACLRYWHETYHIDGFRLVGSNLPLERIANDPFLSDVRIFSDGYAYDLLEKENVEFRHLYIQNDAMIYPLRKLQNHMDGAISELANLMKRQNEKYGFVNYAASSDGFTLYDVYSYSEKHNEANGEDNRDGSNFNYSHNFGVEGETNSRNVMVDRMIHIRTALLYILMSQGIPLIQAGDLSGNTQNGNNNSYCQDNPTGWVTFSKKRIFRDLLDYAGKLIEFRKQHEIIRSRKPMTMTDTRHIGFPDLSYHGREPWTVWLSDDLKSVGMLYSGAYGKKDDEDVLIYFNFYFGEEEMHLPKAGENKEWRYVTNTFTADFCEVPAELPDEQVLKVPGGSATILVSAVTEKKSDKEKKSKKKL